MKIKVTKCFRSELSDEIYDDPIGFTDYTEKVFDDLQSALDYFNNQMGLWMIKLKEAHEWRQLTEIEPLHESNGSPFSKHRFEYLGSGDIYTYYMPEMTIIED